VLLRLFLLFTLVPLLELVVLVEVGRLLGWVPTLAILLVAGALGAWLARLQGLRVVRAVQAELAAGRMPAEQLLDGALVLVAAALLLTPGLVTDLCGLLLLAPPLRGLARRALAARIRRRLRPGGPAVLDARFRRE
jgi:UPF0716 protein FxsA